MKECINHPFYEVLKRDYSQLLLDFVILENDQQYLGESSHKQAVIESFSILNLRTRVANHYQHPHFDVDEKKMICHQCSVEEFFLEVDRGWVKTSETTAYRDIVELNYYLAFFEPPYGTNYTIEDFHKINDILFPIPFRKDLEIYRWNDDFSNYFDDGKEWWGTALWSLYDKWTDSFVVIGASLTD